MTIPSLFYCLLAVTLSAAILPFNYFITPDGAHYIRMAINIWSGRGIISNFGEAYVLHPPFYSFLIGFASLFIRDAELSSHWVAILAFALTVIPLFFLVRRIYPGKTAHWVCLLFATNGFLLIYSNMVLADSLLCLMIVTLLLVFHLLSFPQKSVEAHGPTRLLAMTTGFAGGLAYLTRPEGLLFYVIGLTGFLVLSTQTLRSKMTSALLSAACLLVLLLPYLNFIHHHTGKWQLSPHVPIHVIRRTMDVTHPGAFREVKKNIYAGLTPDKKDIQLERMIREFHFWDYAARDRFALFRAGVSTLPWRILEICKYLYAGLGLLLIGAGFFDSSWNPNRKKSEALLAFFLLPFLSHQIMMADPRRMISIFPVLLIWTGHGVEAVSNWAVQTFRLRKESILPAVAVCLILALCSGLYLKRCISTVYLPIEHKIMGQWMKENIPGIERERVAAEHPYVNYYSGSKYMRMPYVEKLEDLLIYLKHQNTRYFTVSEDYEDPLIESYRSLLDENNPPPSGFRRVHTLHGKKKIMLFETL